MYINTDLKGDNCMEVRKHRCDNDIWVWGEYDFYINNKIVAQLRRQLIGTDYAYVYFLPSIYRDNNSTRIDIRYKTTDEILQSAIKIVKKKLYIIVSNTLCEIQKTNIEQ